MIERIELWRYLRGDRSGTAALKDGWMLIRSPGPIEVDSTHGELPASSCSNVASVPEVATVWRTQRLLCAVTYRRLIGRIVRW